MMKKITISSIAIIISIFTIASANQDVPLPIMPVAEFDKIKQMARKETTQSLARYPLQKTRVQPAIEEKSKLEPLEIEVKMGVNTLLPISRGHMNRIITPFSEPVIDTVSEASITTKGNVILVATNSDDGIALFVRQKGMQSSIPLFLKPQSGPPIEVTLKLQGVQAPIRSTLAKRWEESNEYQSSLLEVFEAIMRGDMPLGYTYHDSVDNAQSLMCRLENFEIVAVSRISGFHYDVVVQTIRNIGNKSFEIVEGACKHMDDGLRAVGTFPNQVVEPNGRTELVLAYEVREPAQNKLHRQSLRAGAMNEGNLVETVND